MKLDAAPDRRLRPVTPAGHGREVWAATLASAPRAGLDQLVAGLGVGAVAELVVLAAHPDDETLGLGRLAHRWARTVGPVTGVLATAGEACVDHVMPRPPGIATRRVAEWHTALDELGFTARHVLSVPDGQVAGHESDLTAALDEILAAVAADGRTAVLAAPWRHDPHPDHRAAGRAAAAAAATGSVRLLEYPVWMTYWADPGSLHDGGQRLLVVPHDPAADQAHRRACLAFASQLDPLAPGASPVVPATMLDHQRDQLLIVDHDPGAEPNPPGVPG